MGAEVFYNTAKGRSSIEAFKYAVEEALYEHGHGGYSGTIAEKNSFIVITHVDNEAEAYKLAEKLIDEDDNRVNDKWGDAGCIKFGERTGDYDDPENYLFFGLASS